MIFSIRKNWKNMIFIMIVLIVVFSLGGEALYAGICENALNKCIWENYWGGYLAGGYCFIGYVFCKKYVMK